MPKLKDESNFNYMTEKNMSDEGKFLANKMINFRVELSNLRNSLSTASIPTLKSGQLDSASNLMVPLRRLVASCSQQILTTKSRAESPSRLLTKVDNLQEKLKAARCRLKGGNTNRLKREKEDEITCYESKVSYEDYEKECIRPGLNRYTSMKVMPVKLRDVKSGSCPKNQSYYLGQLRRGQKAALEHVRQSMQMFLQYKLVKMSHLWEEQEKIIELPKKPEHKKTLFIDLDQTLIHCFEKQVQEADINVDIELEGNKYNASFNIRPYAISFLKRISKKWEIIVFTASHQSYSDAILDILDPDRTLFDARLYRQHCRSLANDFHIKDISRVNRDLSQCVIVDNSLSAYSMQIDNGIPIFPYYKGKDEELLRLQTYLNHLWEVSDIREVNRDYFQIHKYSSFDDCQELVTKLYPEN